ncbi:LytR/AlgR family response regulator transcription factor [Echinicola vietnamensis]|uniref:Response regulator of the LytR/AlgR family n=1 Tax=Echinicola vietnamensis (strain DSM 17526 / LMG 23754 / KMM 6221) TaxID=926556 RepID=L0FZB8_ECHVK|nr:LytTR family DNA-binding domain-containing protein [Echinicola vietnamensis]AGA79274.1 response regulator of the LytR/AlgR family [Echinicola vietnamensis DSM 17526]
MLNAIAIDDEPMALEVIKSHTSKVSFVDLKDSFTNAFKALDYLQDHAVDLIFLDIKMPDISGMEFALLPQQKPMIIFTTAYSEHAVKSFELDAVDYLLKPFSLPRFIKACTKANELWMLKNQQTAEASSIFLKTGYEQVKVQLDDILFLEAAGNYVTFQTTESKILTRMTFTDAEKMLPSTFYRIHRSFMVNKAKIDKIERHQVTVHKHTIPIGSSYADNLKSNLIP